MARCWMLVCAVVVSLSALGCENKAASGKCSGEAAADKCEACCKANGASGYKFVGSGPCGCLGGG